MAIANPQQRLARATQPITAPLSLPAPVKGWNTRDELDAMDPLDAITLDNFYPDSTGVKARTGYAVHATGLGSGAVETLAEYRSGSTIQLLGACDGDIFNCSSPGAVGAALDTGFTNDRWQTTNFLNRLFLCNGADDVQIYDGATLAAAAFTGVDLDTLIGVAQYQQRLFFWQANSSGFWYALLNSISGALAFYDLSAFSPRGANLISVSTVTHDGGNGVLDFIAFMMSSGDMLLYFGNDPAQSGAWQLVGRYRVSPPVNIRAICSYGGDSFVTTYDDYMQLQQQLAALRDGTLPPRSKASGAVQEAIIANGSAFGWESLYYPRGRRLIFNVPNTDGTFDQHVCNTSLPTQPWCRFQGMNASTWVVFSDGLYFGGAGGTVYHADNGFEDVSTAVSCVGQQAWNKIDNAQRKRMSVVRPIIQSTQGTYDFAVGFDYQALDIPVPATALGEDLTDGAGLAITDGSGEALTTGAAGINIDWRVAGDTGTAFGFGLRVSSAGQTAWLRTDFRLEQGIGL